MVEILYTGLFNKKRQNRCSRIIFFCERELKMKEYLKNSSDVLAELNSSEAGLEQSEAEKRLAEHGENRLAQGKKESVFHKFLVQFSDPMIIILIVAAIVSAVTSAYNREFPADVIIIMIVVLINAVLGVYQETKAEKAIDALKEMAATKSRVKRGGKTVLINSSMLVPGDVVALEAGDSVPADCRILHSASMKAEEAALTGESVPVEKSADEITAADGGDVPLGDRKKYVLYGLKYRLRPRRSRCYGNGHENRNGQNRHRDK